VQANFSRGVYRHATVAAFSTAASGALGVLTVSAVGAGGMMVGAVIGTE
jgi:hypothetical protein